MGKAVPKSIKSKANFLLKEFKDSFGTDYEKNKQFIEGLKLGLQKTSRNLIAGFITRKVNQAKKKK